MPEADALLAKPPLTLQQKQHKRAETVGADDARLKACAAITPDTEMVEVEVIPWMGFLKMAAGIEQSIGYAP